MNVTKEKIAALREQHVRRYSDMIRFGASSGNVRVDECKALIAIWQGTEGKEYSELNRVQRNEVNDAIFDEEDGLDVGSG